MKLMLIAGARPNFMKIASIVDAIRAYNSTAQKPIQHVLVHTGQHYDARMSQAFFEDLGLPHPDIDLGVGSGSHAQQTAKIMQTFEAVVLEHCPDVVLVVGDVNSTIACSLVAAKVTYPSTAARTRPLIAHVEAGLRSFDRDMPEEINRLLTDVLSDFLFLTEDSATENLRREGVAADKCYFVGNTMVDTLLKHRQKAEASPILTQLGLQDRPYAVVTLHRPSNVDHRETFQEILDALAVVAEQLPIVFPMHPRTVHRIQEFQLDKACAFLTPEQSMLVRDQAINCLPPLGYLDFLCLTAHAKLVLTDSGGVQEETTVLGVPCVTMRYSTERPVTITDGTNVLAGPHKDAVIQHACAQLRLPTVPRRPRLWDGHAGERIIRILAERLDGINDHGA